jgi:protein-S-isoprenylcysteine O-methyltransferase Ste14
LKINKVQTIRKAVLFGGIVAGTALIAVTTSTHPGGGRTHEFIEWVGIVLIVTCILGRTWTSLYIGGRKIEQLVQNGPYSMCRNPLYFFSVLGAAGVGAQVGTVTLAVLCAVIAWAVFAVVVRQEERLLSDRYGADFAEYRQSVPRFLPSLRLWRDEPSLTIRQPRVLRTFADALLFLLSVPIAELFEALQGAGLLPVLLHLP